MNVYSKAILFVLAAVFAFGCAGTGPKGATDEEKRESVLKMKDDTLAQLYAAKPEAQYMIENAAGYGVFSDESSQILYLGAGKGYGVVEDNTTGNKTFMNVAIADVGAGFGIKKFRAVFIFNNPDVMNKFINSGWEFGPEADAALKYKEKGEAATATKLFENDIVVYQITESGITAKAGLRGMKFWRNAELNND